MNTARLHWARAFSVACLAACASSSSPSTYDGHTHWLQQCDDGSQCGELECICGVCSLACSEDGDCDAAPDPLVCVAPDPEREACETSPARFCQARATPSDALTSAVDDAGSEGEAAAPEAGAAELCGTVLEAAENLATLDRETIGGDVLRVVPGSDGSYYVHIRGAELDRIDRLGVEASEGPELPEGRLFGVQSADDALFWEVAGGALWTWPSGGVPAEVAAYAGAHAPGADWAGGGLVVEDGRAVTRAGAAGLTEVALDSGAVGEVPGSDGVGAGDFALADGTVYFVRSESVAWSSLWAVDLEGAGGPRELLTDLLPTRGLVARGELAAWFSPAPDLSLGLTNVTGRVLWTDLGAPEARVLADGFLEVRSLATDGRRVSWVSESAEGVQTLWLAEPESGEPAVELASLEADMRGLTFDAGWLYWVARLSSGLELFLLPLPVPATSPEGAGQDVGDYPHDHGPYRL